MKMNGCVIPHTPVAVDFWKIRDCPNARLFFLSHLHGDHIVGLTSSWQYPIYCTPITAEILKLQHNIRESLIHPLDLGVGHILYLDEEKTRTITVTLLDANHCPGACMFLFQGQFGNILYTGDFRYDKGVTETRPLCDISGNLDIIYLDNTYCLPACSFPSRQKCFDQIVDIIRKYPDYDVVIGLRSLGKEDLLVKIALELQEWIAISPKMFELVNILNLPQVFAINDSKCRIRVEPFHHISNKNINAWNEKSPTIAILPTALYCGLNMSPFINQDKVFIVPYSDHSSYTELLNFVSYLRPCSIQPIVRANSRGPFGTSIANRADMTCFSKYLNKSMSVQMTRTLENARTPMFSRPLGSLPQRQGGVKRRKSFKVSKSRIKKMGVIFEDSPVKLNMSEIMKEGSVGKESTPDMVEETFDSKNSFNMKTTACVKENVVKIEIVPQDTQNTASVTFKFTRHTQESNQICNGNTGNESDQNIVSCCNEGSDALKPEEVTSLSQSVDMYQHVNNNTSQENLKEENSKRALCVDSCTFQSSVDLSCESHEYPDLSKVSMRSCNSYGSSNENIEVVDTDDETNQFKDSLIDLSNYSFSSDSCDLVTEDSSQVGQSESAFARHVIISVQSASESQKPQFSDYEIMDQVSPLQNSESQNQSKSKNSYLTCEVKKITPKSVSDKINTNGLKSSTNDTTDVCFFNLKDTERINLSKVNDDIDSHGNDYECRDLQKASNCMTKSHHDVSDIHSECPNDTNNKLQDLKSNGPYETSDKFQNLKSNGPNKTSGKFQNLKSNGPYKTSDKLNNFKSNGPIETSVKFQNLKSNGPYETSDKFQNLKSNGSNETSDKFQILKSNGPIETSDKFQNLKSNGPNKTSDKFQNLKSDGPNKTSDKFQDFKSNGSNKTSDKFQDFKSNGPNKTSDKFQDFKSNGPNKTSDKFQDFKSNGPNKTSDKFQDFKSNGPNKTSDKFQDLKSNKFDKSKAVDLPCDRKEEIQPADITSRSIECDSKKAACISEAGVTNMNCCSCTETRCSLIKSVGTSFHAHELKNSNTCQSQHKEVEIYLPLSLKSKKETSQFTDSDLESSFIKDSLDLDTNVSADDIDMDIITCTSHPYTSVVAKKVLKTQAPRQSIKALKIGKKSTVLCQTSSDAQGNLSTASSTNDINLKLTSLASFCTKGGVCRNAANSENSITEKSIVKGDNEHHVQQKVLPIDLCTKENQKGGYYIVFTNVSVKPLNKYTYRSGR